MNWTLIVLIVVLVAIIFKMISIYNRLIRYKNEYANSFAQIDVQLKRRHDLIPNLVETAKKFMEHEKDTLEAVIKARNMAVANQEKVDKNPSGENIAGLLGAESILTGSLGKLFALSENYPDIKSDGTMRDLMEELSTTENRISYSRQHFNDSAMRYNSEREIFPNSIVSAVMNFEKACHWKMEDITQREAPKVAF